jgi:hypothetical protein
MYTANIIYNHLYPDLGFNNKGKGSVRLMYV